MEQVYECVASVELDFLGRESAETGVMEAQEGLR